MFVYLTGMAAELNKQEREKIFREEFVPHMDSLYNFAYYLIQNEDDARDLLQETLLKSYRYAGYYEKGTNAKAWLLKILKNTFINVYRKKSKQPLQLGFENIKESETSDYSDAPELGNEVSGELIGDEITKAVNDLPVDYRVIILLCDIENFKYEEIAGIMDIPVGTVRSRLHRARNMLKEKLRSYAKKKGYE